ncbi:hypothetical protein DdX_14254 [Ditylenchus destructor]|uniref:F-box domain-containing protein n=1 Tax=Ditylenchus destructor TaxID=166010 RepID=A0AAD4MS86_9BILA|nr:hypothetical protein DdX_14254 [Ditylenchus destructor]
MVLQNDPLIETLVFLTRLELLRMSIVNRRLRSIIADKFAYAPYLVLQYLQYDEHQDVFAHNYGWLWVDKNGARAICPASSRWQILANAKYVRVKFSQLSFCQNPMRIIQPISHFWKNMSMRIDLSYTYNATADFAQLVSTCQRLDLRCQGSLSVFGDIVSGTIERLSITYAGYDHSKHFPVSEVVSYLFTRNETNELRKRSLDINFHLGEQLTRSKSSHIVGEITKRFLASVTKARFSMKWRKECDNELSELHLYNDRINQTLKFVVKNSFVKISVK